VANADASRFFAPELLLEEELIVFFGGVGKKRIE